MINSTILTTKLAGIVGFKNPYNPEYAIIDNTNQASRSGLFVNDNPFVKIEAIKDSQDYGAITDENFNNFLRSKISTSIINVGNAVFNQPDYVDRQVLYKYALNKFSQNPTPNVTPEGNYANVYNIPDGFNCYWFVVSQNKNIAFKISRVFLEFNGTGEFTLHLYNTSNVATPLQSKTVIITSPCQEVVLDWVCDNTGDGYKGDYYLGYFKSECDASLQPFQRLYRSGMVLATVSQMAIYRYSFGKFTDPSKAFDLIGFTPYNLYNGVNPDITVYEDYTDLIIQNEKLFARAIQLDCQISLLSESLASLRSNRNERISQQYAAQIMTQIEGESGEGNVKVTGLRNQFYGAVSSIRKEIEKLKEGYSDVNQIRIETLS